MRLGFFTMPIHPLHRPLAETLKEDRELAAIAELARESGTATPLFDRTLPLYAAATAAAPGLDTAAVLRAVAALDPSGDRSAS